MGFMKTEKKKIILHIDINHCYAQIEEMKYPELRHVPMAVGGKEETRHGIILAKNDLAKTYGIKTGESLRNAYRKCPTILIIHPDYNEYMYYCEKVKQIYREYTDQVEYYGLDEAWLDVTASTALFGDGIEIAKKIQKRVFNELGITVSIGISWNKIFAKFGSDLDKKMGLVEINTSNYKEIVWSKPVEDLFYVGKATKRNLHKMYITTIGKLATCKRIYLELKLGKFGGMIWDFANGIDNSVVPLHDYESEIKSIGNSITTKYDLHNFEEAKAVFYVLSESIASRMRKKGITGYTVSIRLRDKNLHFLGTRQMKLDTAITTSNDIMECVKTLLKNNYDFDIPLRSIGVTVSSLEKDNQQLLLPLFNESENNRQESLEQVIDNIRKTYGFSKVKRCSMLVHDTLTDFNPQEDHTIHPVSYFH